MLVLTVVGLGFDVGEKILGNYDDGLNFNNIS